MAQNREGVQLNGSGDKTIFKLRLNQIGCNDEMLIGLHVLLDVPRETSRLDRQFT